MVSLKLGCRVFILYKIIVLGLDMFEVNISRREKINVNLFHMFFTEKETIFKFYL